MKDYGFEKLSVFLKKSEDIEIESRVKTFFDVTGYPHYENVISNILAFFLDANEEHNLKDLWLKSLFECYNLRANTHIQPGEFEEIDREHPTEDNKRIDIVISLDNTIVAIENKIYATPYNPFDSYHKEISKHRKGKGTIVEILLSLREEDNQKTSFNTTFCNVTYKSLLDQVKKNLGDYIENANEKWLLFMKEVLNNINNLGESDTMNKKWQEFLKGNDENMSSFFDNYSNDIKAKFNFFKALEQGVKDRLNDSSIIVGRYNNKNCESFNSYFSLYVDIQKGEDTIVIEPYIFRKSPAFLVVPLWNRKNKKYNWAKELDLLKKDFPDTTIVSDGSWGQCLRLEKLDFEKGVVLEMVIEKILRIIQIIKNIEK